MKIISLKLQQPTILRKNAAPGKMFEMKIFTIKKLTILGFTRCQNSSDVRVRDSWWIQTTGEIPLKFQHFIGENYISKIFTGAWQTPYKGAKETDSSYNNYSIFCLLNSNVNNSMLNIYFYWKKARAN